MPRLLPGPVRGALSLVLFTVNTVLWTLPLLAIQLLKVAVPARGWRAFWARFQNWIGTAWIGFNNLHLALLNPVRMDVEGVDGLSTERWYVVLANHQTWVDILVLQRVFNRRIPFLKFFLKKELFRVPFLGLAWWSLDFPFLERSGVASKDRETTLEACEKFKSLPVTVMNFVEGTRFTTEKHAAQGSPYAHLLKPKAGGLAIVFSAMGAQFESILDVTIAYPGGAPSMWEFLQGRTPEIRVRVESIPSDGENWAVGGTDKEIRRQVTQRLNALWSEKDGKLGRLLGSGAHAEERAASTEP
jgi:1-acyl-sn-glycerol-3-phosphate acyltransferase